MTHGNRIYEFGPYRLDPAEQLLLREGKPVPIPPKAFEILHALVSSPGHLLSKNELIERVWPDSFVDESNLSQHIFLLRKTLGVGPDGRPYIETIPRRGYRFWTNVREVTEDDSELILAERIKSRVIVREIEDESAAPPEKEEKNHGEEVSWPEAQPHSLESPRLLQSISGMSNPIRPRNWPFCPQGPQRVASR